MEGPDLYVLDLQLQGMTNLGVRRPTGLARQLEQQLAH